MKPIKILGAVAVLTACTPLYAQENNLIRNGSFENIDGRVASPGAVFLVDSVSSSNNTTVDIYTADACGRYYDVPKNYMGSQSAKTGDSYAGFIAYYADDAGFFKTVPGYQKYSEYTQFSFSEPLVAGKAYTISYNISLADESAYAVSGIGVCFTDKKVDVENNAFLKMTPHIIWAEVQTDTEWKTLSSTYVAAGGERYLTLGCFDDFMVVQNVIGPNENNSRKAYYYLDEVSLTPAPINTEVTHITAILAGSCFQLSNLNFELDKAVILEDSYAELNSLVRFLKEYPYIGVYLDGHTDKTGTEKHNDKLSQDRATAVKNYLVKNGIDEDRLLATGYGEKLPIDSENENSLANRRVEITICDYSKK